MANQFKNYFTQNIGDANTVIYTAPSGAQSTIIGITMCNISNQTVAGSIFVAPYSGTNTFMVKGCSMTIGSALVPVGGDQKLVLEGNDAIYVYSNTSNAIDAIVSVLEIV